MLVFTHKVYTERGVSLGEFVRNRKRQLSVRIKNRRCQIGSRAFLGDESLLRYPQ